MYIRLHVQYPVFLLDLMDLEFSQDIFEKYSNAKFYENPPGSNWVLSLRIDVRTDGRTDGETKLSLTAILQKRLKVSCHLFRLCLSHSFMYSYENIEILAKLEFYFRVISNSADNALVFLFYSRFLQQICYFFLNFLPRLYHKQSNKEGLSPFFFIIQGHSWNLNISVNFYYVVAAKCLDIFNFKNFFMIRFISLYKQSLVYWPLFN
jgi:hypothetical protein